MWLRTPITSEDYRALAARVLERCECRRRCATVAVSGPLSDSGEVTTFVDVPERLELSWTSDQDYKEHQFFLLHSAWETMRIGDTFVFNHINGSDEDEPNAPKYASQIVIVMHP